MLKHLCWLLVMAPVAALAEPAADTAPVTLEAHPACLFPAINSFPLPPTLAGFTVSRNGSVKDVLLADASGVEAVDNAAKACVSAWRYRPATHGGKAVEKPWQDIIEWNMRGRPVTNTITVANKPPPPPGVQQPTSQNITPVSIGRPHNCIGFYPQAAADTHAEGRTLMSFHVAVDGSTKDITVAKSSGNADLDAASITCVAQWQYRPGMANGVPVEMPWQAFVQWSFGGPRAYDMPPVRLGSASCAAFYTPEMVKQRPTRSLLVKVTVGADGLVRNAETSIPPDALLDQPSVACVKSWQYKPALKDGAPVEASMLQFVNWSMQGLLLPKAPQSCAKFAGPDMVAPSGIEGITGVHFRVTPDGRAEDVAVDRSSTSDALDQAARSCAAAWRFDTQCLALPRGGYPQHVMIDWQRELAVK